MLKYDIIIIGAGLGGLLCANILSKEGYNVCIIEKNKKIGGSIQSFAKNKSIFNTGLNLTEALGEGEVLNRYFKYFGILDKIKIKRMDIDGFERISFGNDHTEYPFAQGYDNFIEKLSQHFPNERNNLVRYIKDMEKICNSFALYSFENFNNAHHKSDYLNIGAYQYLSNLTSNKKLNYILAGMSSLYAGDKNNTPMYIHSLINYTFIKSAWRFIDGGSHLAACIASEIKKNGGTIILNETVTNIGGEAKVEYVETNNGEKYFAKKIISNLHPKATLALVDKKYQKTEFQSRINSMENSIGMFSLYAVLKKDKLPYFNYNHHYFKHINTWTTNYKAKDWPEHYMLYTPANSKSDKWADALTIITYMKYSEVKKWENTYIEQRGEEYIDFKKRKAEILLDCAEKKIPDIRSYIDCYYTSTPLTYKDYTGTPEGSAYGIIKKFDEPTSTIIKPKTRIKNLYFTGQNINMHGILGVSIGSVLTCAEILGYDYLFNKIKNIY